MRRRPLPPRLPDRDRASRGVWVVGSINTDLVVAGVSLPRPGETVVGGRFSTHQGGKGGNQAVAAARAVRGGELDGRVRFIGAVGDDEHGQGAIRALEAEGVDLSHVRRLPGVATGVALIVVGVDGENQIAVAPGANDAVTAAEVRAALAGRLGLGDVVLASMEVPYEAVIAAAVAAQDARATFVLNPAPAGAVTLELLRLTGVLTPNETELRHLSELGEAAPDAATPEAAIDRLMRHASGCRLAVTRGSRGVLTFDAGRAERIAAIDVDPVDATGAGDTFSGVLAAALGERRGGALGDACGRARGDADARRDRRAARQRALTGPRLGQQELVGVLQEGLARRATDARREWWERYLRGAIGFRGVAMAGIREALHEWYRDARVRELSPDAQRGLAWTLLRQPLAEDKLAGILLLEEILLPAGAASCAESLQPIAAAFEDGAIAEWSTTDWLCVRVLGRLIEREGEPCARAIAAWRGSGTLWGRRAALVAFVRPAPRGDRNFPGFSSLVLEVAVSLAPAPERFLQTAVGWTLRDLSSAEPERVTAFLRAHRAVLSREAMRMASSRLPDAERDALLGGRFPRRRR